MTAASEGVGQRIPSGGAQEKKKGSQFQHRQALTPR